MSRRRIFPTYAGSTRTTSAICVPRERADTGLCVYACQLSMFATCLLYTTGNEKGNAKLEKPNPRKTNEMHSEEELTRAMSRNKYSNRRDKQVPKQTKKAGGGGRGYFSQNVSRSNNPPGSSWITCSIRSCLWSMYGRPEWCGKRISQMLHTIKKFGFRGSKTCAMSATTKTCTDARSNEKHRHAVIFSTLHI